MVEILLRDERESTCVQFPPPSSSTARLGALYWQIVHRINTIPAALITQWAALDIKMKNSWLCCHGNPCRATPTLFLLMRYEETCCIHKLHIIQMYRQHTNVSVSHCSLFECVWNLWWHHFLWLPWCNWMTHKHLAIINSQMCPPRHKCHLRPAAWPLSSFRLVLFLLI